MLRSCSMGLCLVGLSLSGNAQGVQAPVAFEVAAIYEVRRNDATLAAIVSGDLRPNVTVTDGRLIITYLSLSEIVRRAFRVEPYEFSGPTWLEEVRFNIQATLPGNRTRDQVPEMLQKLLTDRFKLVVHREQRDVSAYALLPGKDGPRLRESPPEVAAPGSTSDAFLPNSAANSQTSRGMLMKTDSGVMRFSLGPDGSTRVQISGITMPDLARQLRTFVGRPVFDRTGLNGAYDVALEFSGSESAQMLRFEGGGAPYVFSPQDGHGSIARSLEQMGLRLESRRMPIEVVVIDSIERAPTPN